MLRQNRCEERELRGDLRSTRFRNERASRGSHALDRDLLGSGHTEHYTTQIPKSESQGSSAWLLQRILRIHPGESAENVFGLTDELRR